MIHTKAVNILIALQAELQRLGYDFDVNVMLSGKETPPDTVCAVVFSRNARRLFGVTVSWREDGPDLNPTKSAGVTSIVANMFETSIVFQCTGIAASLDAFGAVQRIAKYTEETRAILAPREAP